MNRKKILTAVIIILFFLITLFTAFIIWYIKNPSGMLLFPEFSHTFINRYIKYEWNCGKTENDNVKAVLTFKKDATSGTDICTIDFTGSGDMIDFDINRQESWHSLNNISIGWIADIKRIEINDGITSIGNYTFINNSFDQIYIPSSVTYIGEHAFYKCSSLTDINYNGTKEQWDSIKLDSQWHDNSVIKHIVCTDGEISIS